MRFQRVGHNQATFTSTEEHSLIEGRYWFLDTYFCLQNYWLWFLDLIWGAERTAVTEPTRLQHVWKIISGFSALLTVIISLIRLCLPRAMPRNLKDLLTGALSHLCSGPLPLSCPLSLFLLIIHSQREILSQAFILMMLAWKCIFFHFSSCW